MGMEARAVVGDDASGLLSAMLERMQAERRDRRSVGHVPEADHPALLVQRVSVRHPIVGQVPGRAFARSPTPARAGYPSRGLAASLCISAAAVVSRPGGGGRDVGGTRGATATRPKWRRDTRSAGTRLKHRLRPAIDRNQRPASDIGNHYDGRTPHQPEYQPQCTVKAAEHRPADEAPDPARNDEQDQQHDHENEAERHRIDEVGGAEPFPHVGPGERESPDCGQEGADPGADPENLAREPANEREQGGDREDAEYGEVHPGHRTATK